MTLNASHVHFKLKTDRQFGRSFLPLLCKARSLNLKVSAGVKAGRKYGVCGCVFLGQIQKRIMNP